MNVVFPGEGGEHGVLGDRRGDDLRRRRDGQLLPLPPLAVTHARRARRRIAEAVDRDTLRQRLDAGEFFWLDLVEPSRRGLRDRSARSSSSIRCRSRTRSTSASGRSSRTTATTCSSSSSDGLRTRTGSSRCTASTRSAILVTVQHDDAPALDALSRRYVRGAALETPIRRSPCTVSSTRLVDSFFPALADFDDRLDEIEDRAPRRPATRPSFEELIRPCDGA